MFVSYVVAVVIALRLHRAGLHVVITELPEAQAVRRLASFAEAVFAEAGERSVKGIPTRRATDPTDTLYVRQIPYTTDWK